MDAKNEKEYIYNLNLTKFTGIYQILDPNGATIYGYNLYHIFVTIIVALMIIVSLTSAVGLYYIVDNNIDDIITFFYYLGIILNLILSSYKIINILYYSKDIRQLLDVMSDNSCMTYQYYNENVFKKWKKRTQRFFTMYTCISVVSFSIWGLSPYIFESFTVDQINLDGSYSKYRQNCLNLHFILSDDTYNTYFSLFVAYITCLFAYFYFSFVFDMIVILMCFSFSYKLELISDGIQILGHNDFNYNNTSMYTEKYKN